LPANEANRRERRNGFTTKYTKKGSGLNLRASFRVFRVFRGDVWLEFALIRVIRGRQRVDPFRVRQRRVRVPS
jgi:hypothetical protein